MTRFCTYEFFFKEKLSKYKTCFFNLQRSVKKGKSKEKNEYITKSYVQTRLLFYIIAVKIEAFVITVDNLSDPHFEERCR